MKKSITAFIILILGLELNAQNCSAPSTGFIPINDLGQNTFMNAWGTTWIGGLYPNGSNFIPINHKLKGLELASQIQCLDTFGKPDNLNGRMVWLSIGMSNCTQETQQFIPQANRYAEKNPKLILVDGAQGGQTAQVISAPWNSNYNNFWNTVNNRLAAAGVHSKQVQIIWLKEANQANNGAIRTHYDSLVVQFKRIGNELQKRFPNVKLCYLASRISARYANTTLNPEPYAYYTGWAIKKVIEDQLNGDSELQIGVKAPWMAWGIYMWSDGDIPQKTNPDIFIACPTDLNSDGTHPSTIGAQKVGANLLKFFSTDSTAIPWFKNKSCSIINETNQIDKVKTEFTCYPNPFSSDLKLVFKNTLDHVKIVIFNNHGVPVLSMYESYKKEIIIKRNNLSDGFYWLNVSSLDGKIIYGNQKIVITE